MMGASRLFDRKLELAIREAKEILLIVRGGNKVRHKPKSHKAKKSTNHAEQAAKSIEEIVACIDLAKSDFTSVAEGDECLRTAMENGMTPHFL